MDRPHRLAFALVVPLVLGCGGSQEAADHSGWETRSGYQALGTDDAGEVDTSGSKTLLHGGFDWTGVRHDLALSPANASLKKDAQRRATLTRCACLAVAVGDPDDATFMWRGPKPEVNNTNLAVAISPLVSECEGGAANPSDRRASISAIDRRDKDVFIEIEEVPLQRPVASGAIIAPVEPGGHIYVKPRNKRVPYARVGKDKELCRIL